MKLLLGFVIYIGLSAIIGVLAINAFNGVKTKLDNAQEQLNKTIEQVDSLNQENDLLNSQNENYSNLYTAEKTRADNYESLLTSSQKQSTDYSKFKNQYSSSISKLELPQSE